MAGLPLATYNVILVVWDAAENNVSDTVWVDIIVPSAILSPRFFIPGLSGISILTVLIFLGLWRKKR